MSQNDEEEPLDPQVEAIRRKLMRLVMISTGTMTIGLLAVLIVIVYRITSGAGVETGPGSLNEISLPANAAIIDTALNGDRIMLTLELPDGRREIRIHDNTGKLFATYSLSEE